MTKQKNIPPKSRPVSVRLTHEERAQLGLAARGMPLSQYIRARLFESGCVDADFGDETRLSPAERQKLLAQILARLGQSGLSASIVELAELARLGLLPTDADISAVLSDTRTELKALRHDLLRALGLRPKDGDVR